MSTVFLIAILLLGFVITFQIAKASDSNMTPANLKLLVSNAAATTGGGAGNATVVSQKDLDAVVATTIHEYAGAGSCHAMQRYESMADPLTRGPGRWCNDAR